MWLVAAMVTDSHGPSLTLWLALGGSRVWLTGESYTLGHCTVTSPFSEVLGRHQRVGDSRDG